MSAPQKTSLVGQRVGRYRVSRPIGQGGMGMVYEVIQDSIGHRAAIKVLGAQLANHPKHDTYVARFLDEARAVNLINHPGVVQIFDFGDLPDQTTYIMMEFLDGMTLSRRLHLAATNPKASMSIAHAMELVRQMATVMGHAHEKGVVHRDLKPDNLFLIKDAAVIDGERVKILDFGIAKFLDSPERRTTAGLAMGSPLYMSPEQCLGADSLDGQSDVYSLGAVLYQMLCGQPPFIGEPGQVMRQIVSTPIKPIGSRVFNLPAGVVALVDGMLAKNGKARPTMVDVATRITEMIERDELPHGPAVIDPAKLNKPVATSTPAAAEPTTAGTRHAGPMVKATGVGRTARLAVGAVGLLAAGCALGALFGARPVTPPPALQCPPVASAPAANRVPAPASPTAPVSQPVPAPPTAAAPLLPANPPKDEIAKDDSPVANGEDVAATKLKKHLRIKKTK